jgi:hypothetical protein
MLFSRSRSTVHADRLKFAALLLAVAPILPVAPRALAQAVAVAEVDGHVTDSSGQAVVGAQVRMTEVDRAQVHNTTTAVTAFPTSRSAPTSLR